MDFKQAEERFESLKSKFAQGTLSETDFKAQLEELMIQDEQGDWWMIGYETGQWYRNDGNDWVRAEPPGHTSKLSGQRAEGEHKAKEEVNQFAAQKAEAERRPNEVNVEPALAVTLKKPVSKALFFGITAVIVLAIAGIGIGAAFGGKAPVKQKPAVTAAGTSKPVKTSTSKPKPTATAKPTLKPSATPNLAATQKVINSAATAKSAEALAAQANQWNLKVSERFDNTNNPYGWYIGKDVSEFGKAEAKITDGKYAWSYTADKGVFSRSWVYTISLTDFYLTVNAQETSGCESCEFGIVFRNSANNDYYYFGIDAEQEQYFFYLYNGDWKTLIDRTPSSVIHSEGTNKLSLIARGSHFVFFVNDQFVNEITDDTLANGPMGLGIEVSANNQGTFEFDDVILRVP